MNWTHSCQRVAELLSQQLDEPLGLIDRLRLRMHLSMCGNCSNVARQLSALHDVSADLFAAGPDIPDDAAPVDPARARQ